MKKQIILPLVLLISISLIHYACNKPQAVANLSPVANAGDDITIALPTNNAMLDGSKSADPENNVLTFEWKKISGPVSCRIVNPKAVQTQVTSLTPGSYQFQLTVFDEKGKTDKDTVLLLVTGTEMIFENLSWKFDRIDPKKLMVPVFALAVKTVYIRRDNSTSWLFVRPEEINNGPFFGDWPDPYYHTSFPPDIDLYILADDNINDTPDVKVVFH